MARAIEVPVVVKRGTLARSIEGEASTAFRKLGASSGSVAPLGRMLGKITADADEFTKSIEASNARVIAFGASVGVLNGISNAFKELVRVTVSVEKSLTDINVVLGANQSQLAKFGDGLFKVAKNTAQSFEVVAEAATEFARQGLSLEETLTRTNDALILTRLTGIKAADSVKGLTAATNGFAKAGLTTTQIINKLAAVDVKFAVSADGLVEALKRTGAVAMDAGLSFDELIGMVTAAQQTTARGEAVIGNAFKTIFTRVQRPETLETLRKLNIAVDDTAGKSLGARKILENLARSYDGLSRSAKDAVNQQVAGVFQINILKAAVGDLQKQNSIAARATQVSANATDQATQKNKMLNQTIAALTTQSGLALEELAKKIGDIALAPGMRNIVSSFKNLVEGMTKGLSGEGPGSEFAQGLLKGIGNVLTGPGLIVIGGVFMKLFKDLTVFGVNSMKNLLGLNKAAQTQAALQKGIGTLLQTNTAYQTQMAAASGNVNKQALITQRFLAQEVAMRERAAALTHTMAAGAFAGGFGVSKTGDLTRKVKGKGKIPGFAPTGGVPNFASIIDGPGNGKTYDVGRLPASITGGGSFNEPMTISRFLKLSKLKSRSAAGGMTPLGGAMREFFDSQGITHITGQAGKAHIPFSGPKDARSFYQDVFSKPGPQGMNTSAIYERGLNLMKGKNSAFANDPVGAFYHAVNEAHPAPPGKSTNPTAVSIRGHFARGAFESEAIKRMGAQGFSHSNFIVDAARGGKPMEVKARMTESTRASILGKQFKMDQDVYSKAPAYLKAALDENIDRIHSRTKVQQLSSIPGSLEEKTFGRGVGRMAFRGKLRGFASNYAPNFSPIGEAIQREKLQVGAMMGVSPSSVKTRVVQNTALRSSFNPGGFGVISPTIGQNNFADARRMHKGENLRTTNLPNFMTPLPVSGINPLRKPLSLTTTGYTTAIETVIAGIKPDAARDIGAGTARALGGGGGGKIPLPRPAPTGLPSGSLMAGTTPKVSDLSSELRPAGGAMGAFAMNAFMTYSMAELAAGFTPSINRFLNTDLKESQIKGGVIGGALGGFLGGKASKRVGGLLSKGTLGFFTSKATKPLKALENIPGVGKVIKKATEFIKERGGQIAGVGAGGAVGTNATEKGLYNLILGLTDAIGTIPEDVPVVGGADALDAFGLEKSDIQSRLQEIEDEEQFASQVGPANAAARLRMQQMGPRSRRTAAGAARGIFADQAVLNRARFSSPTSIAQRQSGINTRVLQARQRAERARFVGGQGATLLGKQGIGALGSNLGGGQMGLRAQNILRANIEQGNFDQIGEFFKVVEQGGNFEDVDVRAGIFDAFSKLDRNVSEGTAMAGVRGAKDDTQTMEALKNLSQNHKELAKVFIDAGIAKTEMDQKFADDAAMEKLKNDVNELNASLQHAQRFMGSFSSSFADAFSSVTTGASSAKDAMMDFGINVFGTINRIQSERIGNMLTESLFPEGGKGQGFLKSIFGGGKQRGGIIEAQNGMYISGGRTGDKNPAMLEDGEYVLNRNAVKAMGGPGTLDSINFSMAPRFSRGGRLLSPISHSGVPKKSLNKILAEYEAPATLTDPRLSGFAHANDPTLRNVRGDIREYHNKQIQKKFEKQAKKDQLMQTIVGAVVQTGIAQGLDFGINKFKEAKLAKQQDFTSGIMGIDTGPGFIGPMNQPSGAGSVGFDSAAIAKNFGAAMDPAGAFGPSVQFSSAAVAQNFGAAMDSSGGLGPGFNMVPGASSAASRRLKVGQQAGMFKRTARSNAMLKDRERMLKSISRLEKGMSFNRSMAPMNVGGHGGHTKAMSDTFKRAGIKPGDRGAQQAYLQGIADNIASEFGVIGSRAVPAGGRGTSNPGINAMLQRGKQRHDLLKHEQETPSIEFLLDPEFDPRFVPHLRKKGGGRQKGGYIDNIPAMLTGGEFVMNSSAVRRHGSGFFNKLNRGGRIGYQQGGLVGDQSFVQAENGVTQQSNTSESTSNNTTINITVNSGGTEASVSTEGQPASKEKEMAMKIRGAVLSVIKEEKRTGGTLRDVTSET